MKTFICECGKRKEVEDFIIMVICYRCQKEMREIKKEGDEDAMGIKK